MPAVDLGKFFESHEARDEAANRAVDMTGNLLAYPVAYAILSVDPFRFEDYEGSEDEFAEALKEGVEAILSSMLLTSTTATRRCRPVRR